MATIINGQQVETTYLTALYNANYTQGRCYPTLGDGVTIVSANTDWVLGTVTEVVPIDTIATPFHISAIVIESCDVDAVFELALYYGVSNTLMSTVRFSVEGGFFGNQVLLAPSVKIEQAANVSMALASSNGTAAVATISASIVYRLVT